MSADRVPTERKPPAIAAFIGRGKTVDYTARSSAVVTLNSVRYRPLAGADGRELAVVDVTIENASATGSIAYDEGQFYSALSTLGERYPTDPSVDSGPGRGEDYTPFVPLTPLRSGRLVPGERVRGLVILRLAAHRDYALVLVAPGELTNPVAAWALHSR